MEGLNDRCGFIKVPGPHDNSIKNENVQLLTDSQRDSIFSHAFSAIEYRQTGTELVLERLRGFSQSAAMCFESKAQQMKKFVFRLLSPHGLSLSDKPSYIALSYRWHYRAEEASQLDKLKAAVGEFALPIPPLLYGALVKELHSRSGGIWCDKICIDQNNEAEIAVSIGLMDVIYQEARCVAIALADVLISKEEQDWLQKYIPDYLSIARSEPLRWRVPHRGEEPPYLEKNPIFYGIYWKIGESDYFQRAWCSHEMRMGKEHIFLVSCADEENVFRFDGPFLVNLLLITAGVPHNRITDGIICTEDVIMGLAPHLEHEQQARDLVYEIRRQARDNGKPLIDLLVENERISPFLDRAALVQFMSVPLRLRVHNTIVTSITGAKRESVGDLLEPFHNVSELGVGGDQALPEFERKSSARRELHDDLLKTFNSFSNLVAGGKPHLPEYERRISAIWDKISMTLHVARLDVVVRDETYSSITNVDRPFECTQKLALLSLAANEPSLLCTSGEPLACSSSLKSRSWIRAYADGDSSARGSFDFTQHIMDSPSIALSPNDAGLYIELKLCGFKQIIASAGPASWATWRAGRLLGSMIETKGMLHPGERYYNWRNLGRLNEETRRLLLLTVACVLQNGILWILKSLSFNNGDFIFRGDLRTAFQPYIDRGLPGFEMPHFEDEKTEETIINWVRTAEGSQAAQAILQFATSILYKTIPKPWRPDILKPYRPFIISTNANKYIMLGGTELRDSILAFPKALVSNRFSGLRRAWLLDFATIDGKRECTLLGRQRLFGPSICDDIVEWEGLKKVYGPVASYVE